MMAADNVTTVDTTARNGWQYNKSLKDCIHHMLINQISTDISLEVKLPGGSTAGSVKAHKFVLMCRSAVFEKLLTDNSTTSIKIKDMDLDVLNEVLTYIYTDGATVTAVNALPLMYASQKYLLPGLLKISRYFLQERLTEDNVCATMDQSLEFGDTELKEHCVKWICRHMDEVMKTEGFLSLTANALEILVGDDSFTPGKGECDVHMVCITWATSQLQEQSAITQPTDLQIREKLGPILYKIRYSNFTPAEFGVTFRKSRLLSDEEKLSVYEFFTTKEKDSKFLFDWKYRYPAVKGSVNRFASSTKAVWNSSGNVDGIQFMTDKNVSLVGIGLYPGSVVTTVNVQLNGVVVGQGNVDVKQHKDMELIKVDLKQAVDIQAGVAYDIWMSGQAYSSYGDGGKASCSDQGITFSFTNSPLSTSGCTRVKKGQLPQLFFKCWLNEI